MGKPFWDLEENRGYIEIKASDSLDYKVWNGDESEKFQKEWWYNQTPEQQQQVAQILADIRKDLNTILIYLLKNEYLYINDPIAFGIYHAFDLHMACWKSLDLNMNTEQLLEKINKNCKSNNTLFIYQEMRPNEHGIIGLNKPKKIITIKAEIDDNKFIDYELGKERLILLTIRNQSSGKIRNYHDILCLAIHEITHTVCNDVRWVPEWKGGNHRSPYPTYHKQMRKWAMECGVLQKDCGDDY